MATQHTFSCNFAALFCSKCAAMKLKPILLSFLLAAPLLAAEEVPKPNEMLALSADKAGPDFLVQGEYEGESVREGKAAKYAAQIAALGNGKFHAVFLSGGLPGAGWDMKNLMEIDGKTEGQKTVFVGKDFSAEITADLLTGSHTPVETFALKKVVRHSPTEGQKAPKGAVILFDGTNTEAWERGLMDKFGRLITDLPKEFQNEGFISGRDKVFVGPGPTTKRNVKNFTLHLEFIEPFKPSARGQSRGNSGVYIQGRYEVQILDSFGFKLDDKHAVGDLSGEIYKQQVPLVSMNYPPLSWQTYDIDFQSAQFDGDKKTKNAVITVKHNGVVVHDNYEITAKTGAGKPEGAAPAPIILQNHGNPIFFRNIWLVEK